MAQEPQRPAGQNFPYVDRPELSETYADSIHAVASDGQSVKITLAVARMDTLQGQDAPTTKRYTACRLVLPIAAAAALSDQLNRLGATLAQARSAALAQTQPGGDGPKLS